VSEQAKTVLDAYSELCDGDDRKRTPRRVSQDFLKKYGDYHIIGPDSVVSAADVDRACAVQLGCEGAPPSEWGKMPDSEKEAWRFKFLLGLGELGIVVPDEVVEVRDEDDHVQYTAHKDDAEYSYIDLVPGDRVFVKRRED
jgi:hypothetical protein